MAGTGGAHGAQASDKGGLPGGLRGVPLHGPGVPGVSGGWGIVISQADRSVEVGFSRHIWKLTGDVASRLLLCS